MPGAYPNSSSRGRVGGVGSLGTNDYGAGEIEVALIAAGSALLGGVLSAIAGSRVERLKYKASITEKAELRKVDAVQRFASAASAWFEWLGTIRTNKRLSADQLLDENNARSRQRQEAYRLLRLFCSDEMNVWLQQTYDPAERDFLEHFAGPLIRLVIDGKKPPFAYEQLSPTAADARRRYGTLLREDLTARFREEVSKLREP